MRIAMWSGPRNLSTALMYSFASRADMSVVDEPFYAAYLNTTGVDHPMRDVVLCAQPVDPVEAKNALLETTLTPHQYQKHMTQHIVDGVPLDWLVDVVNVFLIRHPARVLSSWSNKHDVISLSDIGFEQQMMLLKRTQSLGQTPVVIDSADIRANPEGLLRALCDRIGLEWDPAMLSWKVGPKPYDGAWAPHWYDAVHRSTDFAGAEGALPELPPHLNAINEKALPIYEQLAALKLSC